jgi:hypothetical protein
MNGARSWVTTQSQQHYWTDYYTDPWSPATPTASATTKPAPTTSDAPSHPEPLRSTGHQVANFAERDWGIPVSAINVAIHLG